MKLDVSFGGQAVIEGVMMRSPNFYSVATLKGKRVKVKTVHHPSLAKKPILRWPFLRGAVSMAEMLILGMKALIHSTNESGDTDEKLSSFEIFYSLLLAFSFAILIFVAAPLFVTKLLVTGSGLLFDAVDGVVRVIFFFIYLYLIQRSKDVRRVFEFHGAEHATINAYEAGRKLSLSNVRRFTTFHPRCGTSFILIVLVVSIAVFSLIRHEGLFEKFLGRLILLPVVAAVSYEFLKLLARLKGRLADIMNLPGRLVQKVTTKKPDDSQIRTAIAALNAVISAEKRLSRR